MTETLKDFVKNNSKFLRLGNGESFVGIYKGYKITQNNFDPDKQMVVYKLAYPDGKEIFWQSSATSVARTLAEFKGGEKIVITRHGEGQKTKYSIASDDVRVTPDDQGDEEVPF